MAQNITWPGSGSAISGSTPFGLYDLDTEFQSAGPQTAIYCARRLGHPIIDIEMQDIHFYACFEEAVTEYSAQVNQFNIRNNLSLLTGTPTGSNNTHVDIQGSGIPNLVRISQDYGAEAGVGGNVTWKKGYFETTASVQTYDLDKWAIVSESGKAIEIKRLYHDPIPAITRYFDPYALTGTGTLNLLNEFGFANYSPGFSTFLLYPVYADLLRIQAIELNEQIRKSQFGFQLINNQLVISPIPNTKINIYFDYIVEEDRDSQAISSARPGTVSDYSNIGYDNMVYSNINDVGRQWIRKYTLALTKESLGAIREKFAVVPINDGDITLDGAALRSEAQTEKDFLIEQLRENLNETSKKVQMEDRANQSDFQQQMLNKIPIPIYIG